MSESSDLDQARVLIGVAEDATAEAVKRAYLQKSYALIRAGASEAEREQLKAAEAILTLHCSRIERRTDTRRLETAAPEAQFPTARAEPSAPGSDGTAELYDPRSFDSWLVNLVMPPTVAGAAVLIQLTPLSFFLNAFHIWIHEFGHATVAWLTGRRALPLPLGWTSVSPEKSDFVYYGILFLLGVLFVAGMRERKIVPMISAVVLAIVQYFMTWKLPDYRAELWFAFSGVGGEFSLSAAMMGLFFFRLPDKFRWELCRYLFLFLGAGAFFKSWLLWHRIKRGQEGIPYGTMIHGEEDEGGDMNQLRDFGWTQWKIIHTYNDLATMCLIVLAVLYVLFALRLDRVVGGWLRPRDE